MITLNYERIAQLIAVSAISRDSALMRQLRVDLKEFSVQFSQYVKSQVHLNIITDLYSRNMSEYVKTLHYLNGDLSYKDDAKRVLSYFYQDMAHFLVNNPENVKLRIIVDTQIGKDVHVNLDSIISEFRRVLNDASKESLESFQYSFIFDDVDNLEDALTKIDSYVLAAVLETQAKDTKNVGRLLIEGGYYET